MVEKCRFRTETVFDVSQTVGKEIPSLGVEQLTGSVKEYDSMIAKVIVHAPDRPAAIRRMLTALDEMVITGVDTNLDFQFQIIRSKVFREGKADTGFIEKFMNLKQPMPDVPEV